MTTNFPTSVDAFTNPTSNDTLDNPPHDQQHADINDAMEAVQTSLLDGAPLHIDSTNSRVGIGTTSPASPLHVEGNIRTSSDSYINNGSGEGLYIDGSNNKVQLNTTGTSHLTIDSSGNVDINSGSFSIGGTAVGEWGSFSWSWTADGTTPSLGNGTQWGRYVQVGDLIIAQYGLKFGSTTTAGSGYWRFGYPVTPNLSDLFVAGQIGQGRVYDYSAGNTDNLQIMSQSSSSYFRGLTDTSGILSGTVPWTFATNDECLFQIIFKAA